MWEVGDGTKVRSYSVRGFQVTLTRVDMKFKSLKDRNLLEVQINAISKDDHVPKIESLYRLIRERACCYYEMLPFNSLLHMMVQHLMKKDQHMDI